MDPGSVDLPAIYTASLNALQAQFTAQGSGIRIYDIPAVPGLTTTGPWPAVIPGIFGATTSLLTEIGFEGLSYSAATDLEFTYLHGPLQGSTIERLKYGVYQNWHFLLQAFALSASDAQVLHFNFDMGKARLRFPSTIDGLLTLNKAQYGGALILIPGAL